VIVPAGHAILNFTEIRLFSGPYSDDLVTIYDGNNTSNELIIGNFQGSTPVDASAWFVASSNTITVKFYSGNDTVSERTFRFKAIYTMNITEGMYYFV
jgi:hypothetical protein